MMLPSAFPLVAALTVPSLHGYGSASPVLPARLVQMSATASDSTGILHERVAVYFGKLAQRRTSQKQRSPKNMAVGGGMRGVLLLLALTVAHARWALLYWPQFDVSTPNCKLEKLKGEVLTYPKLSCGSLSQTCFPSTCINACTADERCSYVVVDDEAARTCQFRCKEHMKEDIDPVPRLDYTTYNLVDEITQTTMDLGPDTIFVDQAPSLWAQWMIRVAVCLFVFSLVVMYCTGPCTISEGTNTPFGFEDGFKRLDEEQGAPSPGRSPGRASITSAAKEAAIKAREEAQAAVAVAKAAALKAKAEAEAKAKALADKKTKSEAEAKAKAMKDAEMKAKSDAEANAKAMKDAEKAGADAKAKAKAEADALAKAQADAKAKAKAEADVLAKAQADAKAKAKAEADALAKAQAAAKAKSKTDADALAKAQAAAKAAADALAKAEAAAQAKAKVEADALAKLEALAKAKAKAEADAIKEAEAKLKAAMPYPFKYAEPAKLGPAIEAAKKVAGVSQVAIEAAEAKLNEALAAAATADKQKSLQKRASELTMTAAGLLDNDKGRDKLVQDRFEQADDDNSGTLDTDEVISLIGTL